MKLTVESLMFKYNLNRDKAEDIFDKTAASIAIMEEDPLLQKRLLAMQTKRATLSDPVRQALIAAAGGVVAAAGGALAMKGIDGLSSLKNRAMRDRNIKQMQANHADLRNYAPKDLHLAYNTLARVSPEAASDPLVGGQFIKYVVSRNDVPIDMLNNISKLSPGPGALEQMVGKTVAQSIARAPEVYMNARDTQFRNNMASRQMENQERDSHERTKDLQLRQEMAELQNTRQDMDSQLKGVEHGWKSDLVALSRLKLEREAEKIKQETTRLEIANGLDLSTTQELRDPNQVETFSLAKARGQLQQADIQYDPHQQYQHLLSEARVRLDAANEAAQGHEDFPKYLNWLKGTP